MKAVNLLPADHKPVRQANIGAGLSKTRSPSAEPRGNRGRSSARPVVPIGLELSEVEPDPARCAERTDRSRLTAVECRRPECQGAHQQVTAADATRMSWDGFMTKLARVLPEDVWLVSMQAQETPPVTTTPGATDSTAPATPAPAAAPTGFTISGFTYSQASVARLMRRLSMLPWLSDVSLQSSNVTTVGAHSVFQFTIVGAVNSLPAKEAS